MAQSSPLVANSKQKAAAKQLSARATRCWDLDFDWELIPKKLQEVCKLLLITFALKFAYTYMCMQACEQISQALSIPPTAVLAGLLLVVSFSMSHSIVEVDGTDWKEPVLLWLSVVMPTGMGKSPLCKFLRHLVRGAHDLVGLSDSDPAWLLDDQSFEKMGDSMSMNHCKLLGLYDELSTFLAQLNICRGRGITESHEGAMFLQLYGGDPWIRRTGTVTQKIHVVIQVRNSFLP